MKAKISLIALILFSLISKGQTLWIEPGIAYSKLDWNYLDPGNSVKQYKAPITSYSLTVCYEYLEHTYWSIKSDISLYKSGGNLAKGEENLNHSFESDPNISLGYLSAGTYFNYNPLNKKLKIQISCGPRVDKVVRGTDVQPYQWLDSKQALNKMNWGYDAGIEISYIFNYLRIGINNRMRARINDLADLQPTGPNGFLGVDAKEQVCTSEFCIGYTFK